MKFDIYYFFSAKHAQWIIISLIVIFSLLIISELSQLFFSRNPTTVLSSTEVNLESNVRSDTSNDLLHSSLFGVYVANDLTDDNVKKSKLNVTLVGVLLGDKIDESQVIIRSANGEEETYRIDDKIPGGALIKRIMAGGVLVERNGALESLSLPKNNLTFEPVPKEL